MMANNTHLDDDLPFDVVEAANRFAAMGEENPAVQSAVANLGALERKADLPSSRSAMFIQIFGALTVCISIFAAFENIVLAMAGVISGGFIIAAGYMQQAIFDIRTLMLRTEYGANSGAQTHD